MPVVLPKRPQSFLTRTPVASAVVLALGSPLAAAQQQTTSLGEVIVTAQKRAENLQDVPISLNSLGTETLQQLNIQNFKNYVQFLPTVSQQPFYGSGSGFNLVYMRGVATGGDGQAITSQPSVGTYLDEQPITTVQGNLDVHLYDIARVEALAGPQGTLFGASSQSGTIRIITNQPDPSAFAAGYSLEGNYVDADEPGYVAEGFVNIPIGENMAIRLVGWGLSEAGWIDNVPSSRTYPGDISTTADDVTVSNDEFVEDNYNTIDTLGLRAALRVNLGENWTLTPSFMYQTMEQEGSWGDDHNDYFVAGKNTVAAFRDEFTDDEWWQAGLTIEGAIGSFDVVYSGNYLDRDVDAEFDYSDYSYFYDVGLTTGSFANLFVDNNGGFVNRAHSYTNDDHYDRRSHELRISTDPAKRVRGLLGFFYQRQYHDFYQQFGNVEGLADFRLMNYLEPNSQSFPGVVYLNSMDRTDTDEAVFGQVQFDITDRLELSLGARYFEAETKVRGFFGFGLGFNPGREPGTDPDDMQPNEPGDPDFGGSGTFIPADPNVPLPAGAGGAGWSRNGEWRCVSQEDRKDAPCVNADRLTSESDQVFRVNLGWKANDTTLLYATWSEGFRPAGINRNPTVPDFIADFLTNYELGWKTRWADDRLQINGAVFLEEWDDIQVAFQGANGITQVENGPEAEIAGLEVQLDWLVTDRLRLQAAGAYYDTELTSDYTALGVLKAPAGTELPVTGDFKGNLIARYDFPLGGFDAYTQGAVAYEGSRSSLLNVEDAETLGDIPSSTFLDLAFGISNEKYGIELFISNATDEDSPLNLQANCEPGVCGAAPHAVTPRPRTYGIRFRQDF